MLNTKASAEKKRPPGQYFSTRWAIYAALGIPEVDVGTWKLKISGLVERPSEFTYQELIYGELVKLTKDFHCVTKWSIADVIWEGIPFRKVAEAAKVKSETEFVMFHCLDGYTAVVPLQDAMTDDSLIVFKMNGEPLSQEQGFPARPFIPHLYGWKSAKWLTEIEFIKDYADGYWEMYGYHEVGYVWREERFKEGGGHSKHRSFGTKQA